MRSEIHDHYLTLPISLQAPPHHLAPTIALRPIYTKVRKLTVSPQTSSELMGQFASYPMAAKVLVTR